MRKGDAERFRADPSDRGTAEDELRRTQEYLRAIIETEPECVKLIDRDGRLLDMNAAGLAIVGANSLDEVVGQSVFDLVVPEHRARYCAMHERVCAGGRETLEYEIVGLKGERRWLESHAVPLRRDRPPTPLHLAITRDITQRLVLEEQLRQTQKMQAVGQLAGGIAHDFNNLLTVILGCGEILLREMPPPARHRETVGEILQAARRAAGLTQQLLTFSRKQASEPVSLKLNHVIDSIESLLRRLIGAAIRFETSLAPSLPSIRVGRGQIEQVLVNLVVNARDAMPEGGQLTISTAPADPGCATHSESNFPSWIRLTVADTGCGIDEAIRDRIFEPFFTTKPAGEGTGLGLAVVLGIVQQSGGRIEVDSQPGRGSRFHVYLPTAPISCVTPQADQADVV